MSQTKANQLQRPTRIEACVCLEIRCIRQPEGLPRPEFRKAQQFGLWAYSFFDRYIECIFNAEGLLCLRRNNKRLCLASYEIWIWKRYRGVFGEEELETEIDSQITTVYTFG